MYSSSFGYLPNKKQSNIGASVPHNFSLFRNYSKSTIPQDKFVSSSPEMSPSLKPFDDKYRSRPSQFAPRTQSIMSFVCTLGGSRFNRTHGTCQNLTDEKSKHNCKELVVQYNNMPSMPLVSSHLIGGFVGSKSQLGRTQGFEVKMWDIVRDLFSLVGSSPTGKSFQKTSPIDKRCALLNSSDKHDSLTKMVKSKELETKKPKKQSYAEVTKCKLPVERVDCFEKPSQNNINPEQNKMKDSGSKYSPTPSCVATSVIETISKCKNQTLPQNRDRITSECSADSEDSFIVFENCEGDCHILSVDDISNSSDDDNDFHIKGELSSEHRRAPSSTSTCGKSTKKVRFAEGKDLKKIHPMITWDFAYRMARPGPWEMLARDSERFRCRIKNTEAILKPVLDQQHREAVYQHRFAR